MVRGFELKKSELQLCSMLRTEALLSSTVDFFTLRRSTWAFCSSRDSLANQELYTSFMSRVRLVVMVIRLG